MNDKDIFNIKELIKFLEDNHTKENGYKFQIRVIVNKTLNGKLVLGSAGSKYTHTRFPSYDYLLGLRRYTNRL